MFNIRTTPVEQGTKPYVWGVDSVWQCTWYAYYRCLEVGFTPPCYWDKETKTGSYTNAKDWIKNDRSPWQVKGIDYIPVAGDIAVFDGTYGHVVFMETATKYSEYRNGNKDSFANGELSALKKQMNLLGYLHYPYTAIENVERNSDRDQVEVTDTQLRIRTKPSLSGEIVGHVMVDERTGKGYYNVLSVTKNVDGYDWYEIANGRYIADITTTYLPKDTDDFLKQFEQIYISMKSQAEKSYERIQLLENKLAQINDISNIGED